MSQKKPPRNPSRKQDARPSAMRLSKGYVEDVGMKPDWEVLSDVSNMMFEVGEKTSETLP
jgi:hypothetical protein